MSSASYPTQVWLLMGSFEVWAVAEGQALAGSGSPDLCAHSGPPPCHGLICTIKFRSCFPNLLCLWACHPRTLITFRRVPAGKNSVILPISTPLSPALPPAWLPLYPSCTSFLLFSPSFPALPRGPWLYESSCHPYSALSPLNILMQCAI